MAKNTNGMGAKALGGGADKVTNSGQRVTVGDSVYSTKPDAPSATEFRAGMVEGKPGMSKADPLAVGTTSTRKSAGLARSSLGPRFSPAITHRPGFVENASVQANGRTVPAVMGVRNSFYAEA
jgi:hypothetical protein